VRVRKVRATLTDLDDETMATLATLPLRPGLRQPKVSVLVGCTDDFFAQARVNRLALHLGLPSLCAQLYREGRGAEVTFTYPGLTPACHRCILAGRYRSYENGYRNDVGSARAPIFVTGRVNSLKGQIALALLHFGLQEAGALWPDDPSGPGRWAALAERMGDRNIVLVRMDPDVSAVLGLLQFDRALEGAARPGALFFDDVLWLSQRPEGSCPDCGGTGDLRSAAGAFDDTRRSTFIDARRPRG
jgi:hypothetical protein